MKRQVPQEIVERARALECAAGTFESDLKSFLEQETKWAESMRVKDDEWPESEAGENHGEWVEEILMLVFSIGPFREELQFFLDRPESQKVLEGKR